MAADIEVLLPDIDVEAIDPDTRKPVTLTVREFRFLEGLEAQVVAAPLLADLAKHMDAEGARPGVRAIHDAVGRHAGVWLDLVARATGRDAEWLARLSDADGTALSTAMWVANKHFFSQRVAAMVPAKQAKSSRSATSSGRSSAPDKDRTTASSAS